MKKSPSSKPNRSNHSKTSSRRELVKNTALLALASQSLSSCQKSKTADESDSKRPSSKKIKWKMATTWPKNFPILGTGANKLAQYIDELSDGALKIKIYGAGELVPALEVFDAVSRGTIEMGHGASYYWQGKHEASSFFAAVPFGLTAQEINAWISYGGGQKLWDELYAPFGLKAFSAGNTGVQMGGWFNKEIRTVQDFKGLKMRMPGLGGKVLSRLGSAVVTLSGGEIFQALKSGNIDGTEWVGPFNDRATGLHKAAKFYYWPGWHEPGTSIEALINKQAFEKLPKHLKLVVERACQAANQDMLAEATYKNAQALKVLVEKDKVNLKKFPDDVLKKLKETSEEVVKEISNKNELSQRVFKSFKDFLNSSQKWNEISEVSYAKARSL